MVIISNTKISLSYQSLIFLSLSSFLRYRSEKDFIFYKNKILECIEVYNYL